MSDLSGELIDGRYELLQQIAIGGMATIYVALDTRLDRKVAVKIMHSHLADDEKFVNRFIREAKAAAALSHPNIVAIQDQGWNQGGVPAVFLVMELIEGYTLRDYIFEQGALPPSEVIRLLVPVLSAIAAAHKIGIVHRDIKPENILISTSGRIKVADFGLAHGELIGSTLTAESSVILGSISYLSPEQVQRGIADARSDVYSIGIMTFELLTGEKPFAGDSPINIAYKHVNDRVPAPSTLVPGIPASLDALVLRATSVNPDDRPRDAGELLEEIREIQVELDPKRVQLSLELDLPPLPIRNPSRSASQEKSRKASRVLPPENSVSSGTVSAMASNKDAKNPRERTSGTNSAKKKITSARIRRNRWIAVLVALFMGIGLWFAFTGLDTHVAVPTDLVGKGVSQATVELSQLGLQASVTDEVFSEDISRGIIISTKPAGGGSIAPDGTVSFTVSKGPERYLVPVTQGLTPAAAATLLGKSSLIVGVTAKAFDPKIHEGLIISSTPSAGTSVTRSTTINLIVSKGIQKFPITTYVGKSGDQALNELTTAGFKVSPTYAFSDTVPIGIVISQTPNGGASAPKGTNIALVVSKGSESVFIPNVYSLTEAKATAALQDLDLKVWIKRIGTRPVKVVIDISPKVGSKVLHGSAVIITVG